MGMIYLDSFDGYVTGEQDQFWANNAAGIGGFINGGTDPRTGSGCARPSVQGWGRGMQIPPILNQYGTGAGSLQNEVVIGAAVKFDSQSSSFVFQFMLSTAAALGLTPTADLTSAFVQGGLHLNSDRTLSITYGSPPTVVAVTSPKYPMRQSIYQYIEWKVQFGTLGYSEVRVNDFVVQSGNVMQTPVPLTIGGSATVNRDKAEMFMIGGGGGGGAPVAYDDLYILTTDGVAQNVDFLGDSRVNIFMPSGSGSNTQWTPVGSSSNWQNVNEIPWDDDTTYNSSTTTAFIDDYAHIAISSVTDNMNAVQAWSRVKNTGSSTQSFAVIVDDAGAATVSTNTQIAFAGAYGLFHDMFDTNISAVATWTSTDFNNTAFGIEKIT